MNLLDRLEGIAGYHWSAWCGEDGDLQFSATAPSREKAQFEQISRIWQQLGWPDEQGQFLFANGMVLVRRIEKGWLWLFCALSVELGILEAMLQADPAKTSGAHQQSDSQMRLIQSVSLEHKPVPTEVIETLLELYTETLGPLARVLARKECQKVNLDLNHLDAAHWARLLNLLAARIESEPKREDFLDRAILLKTRF